MTAPQETTTTTCETCGSTDLSVQVWPARCRACGWCNYREPYFLPIYKRKPAAPEPLRLDI